MTLPKMWSLTVTTAISLMKYGRKTTKARIKVTKEKNSKQNKAMSKNKKNKEVEKKKK